MSRNSSRNTTDCKLADLPGEEWRDVVGYEGYYQVSNMGRVKSVARIVPNRASGINTIRPRILRQIKHSAGYLTVIPSKNSKQYPKLVHHVVLEAFVGPRPEGMEGCHEDDDKTNNRLSNLRWDTRESNLRDRRMHGKKCRKLKLSDVKEIRRRYATGKYSQQSIADVFGVTQVMIGSIVRGESWKF